MKSPTSKPIAVACATLVLFLSGALANLSAEEIRPPEKRIAAIEKKYSSLKNLSAKFTQKTHIDLIDRTIKKKGKFRFMKGGKFRIEYAGANQKSYVCNGKTLWVFIPGDLASFETFKVNDKNIPREATSFFGGYTDLKKYFFITSSTAFKRAGKNQTALHLVPKSKSSHFKSLDALFGVNNILEELTVTNQSGNVSKYRFRDIHTNQTIDDSIFSISREGATPSTLPR
jgi:outer membrane lipoprotein-sorting protein